MAEVESRLVSVSIVQMTELVLPQHTNALGSAFGGVIMSWIDIAAAISAQRFAREIVVTAAIDDLHFVAPVYKGWVVNLKACVNFVSRTSMEVGVRVDAENPITEQTFHTASAYLTFVALGADGRPRPVPPGLAQTSEEKRRWQAGEARRKARLQRRSQQRGP